MHLKKPLFFVLCISLLLTNHRCKPAQYHISESLILRVAAISGLVSLLGVISCCCYIGYQEKLFSFPHLSIPNPYKIACSFYKWLTYTKIIANRSNVTKKIYFSSAIDQLTIEKQADVKIIIDRWIEGCFIKISAASNITDLIKTKTENKSLTINYGNYIINDNNIPCYEIHIKELNSLFLSNTHYTNIIGLSSNHLLEEYNKTKSLIKSEANDRTIQVECQGYNAYLDSLPLLTIQLNNSTLGNNGCFHRKILLNTYGNSECWYLASSSRISFNAHDNSLLSIYGGCEAEGNLYDHSALNLKRYEKDYKKVKVQQHGCFTTINKRVLE